MRENCHNSGLIGWSRRAALVPEKMTSTLRFPIEKVVVPIMERGADPRPYYLGTGFFVGQDPVLVTCLHVVEGVKGQLAITTVPDLPNIYPADVITTKPEVDLALLKVPSYHPPSVVQLSEDEEHHGNQLVVCHEYSGTWREETNTLVNGASRVGNITTSLKNYDLKHAGKVTALELSFPGLKGASGAPVMTNDENYEVLGSVVGNIGHELLPVQIDTVLDEANDILEEIKYMLPQGLAIHVRHLKEFLALR